MLLVGRMLEGREGDVSELGRIGEEGVFLGGGGYMVMKRLCGISRWLTRCACLSSGELSERCWCGMRVC